MISDTGLNTRLKKQERKRLSKRRLKIWRANIGMMWLLLKRRGHRLLINFGKKCSWTSEMWKYRCWAWMKISFKARPSWLSSKTFSFLVSLSINLNTLNSWFTKTQKWSNKWKFWKLSLRSTLKLKMSLQSVLISATAWSRNTKLKLKCSRKR